MSDLLNELKADFEALKAEVRALHARLAEHFPTYEAEAKAEAERLKALAEQAAAEESLAVMSKAEPLAQSAEAEVEKLAPALVEEALKVV